MTDQLLVLLNDEQKKLIGSVQLSGAMTPFQIRHFVLNKREFPTPFAQLQQAKREIIVRRNSLVEASFEYRKALATKEIEEMELEALKAQPPSRLRDAQIALAEIRVQEQAWKAETIKERAQEQLSEVAVFLETYHQHAHLEQESDETLAKLEEEYWRIKSAYYPEMREMYQLTPDGFEALPHETNEALGRGIA